MADRMNPYHNPNFARGISNIGKLLAGSAQEDANIALGRHRDALAAGVEDQNMRIGRLSGNPSFHFMDKQLSQHPTLKEDPHGDLRGLFFRDPENVGKGLQSLHTTPGIAEKSAAEVRLLNQQVLTEAANTKTAGNPYGLNAIQNEPEAVKRALVSYGLEPPPDATDAENSATLSMVLANKQPYKVAQAYSLPPKTAAEVQLLEAKAKAEGVSEVAPPLTVEDARLMLETQPKLGDTYNIQKSKDGTYSEDAVEEFMRLYPRTEILSGALELQGLSAQLTEKKARADVESRRILDPDDPSDRLFAQGQIKTVGHKILTLNGTDGKGQPLFTEDQKIDRIIIELNRREQSTLSLKLQQEHQRVLEATSGAKTAEVQYTEAELALRLKQQQFEHELTITEEKAAQAEIATMQSNTELAELNAGAKLNLENLALRRTRLQNLVETSKLLAETEKGKKVHLRLKWLQVRAGLSLDLALKELKGDTEFQRKRLSRIVANQGYESAKNQLETEKAEFVALQNEITDESALRGIKAQIAVIDKTIAINERDHSVQVQAVAELIDEEDLEQAEVDTLRKDEQLQEARTLAVHAVAQAKFGEERAKKQAELAEIDRQIAVNKRESDRTLAGFTSANLLVAKNVADLRYKIAEEDLDKAMQSTDALTQKLVLGLLHESGQLQIQGQVLAKKAIELDMARASAKGATAQSKADKEFQKVKQELLGLKLKEQKINLRIAESTEASKIIQEQEQAQGDRAGALLKEAQLEEFMLRSPEKVQQEQLQTQAAKDEQAFTAETDPLKKELLQVRLANARNNSASGSDFPLGDDVEVSIIYSPGPVYKSTVEIPFIDYRNVLEVMRTGRVADEDLVTEMNLSHPNFVGKGEKAQRVVTGIRLTLDKFGLSPEANLSTTLRPLMPRLPAPQVVNPPAPAQVIPSAPTSPSGVLAPLPF